MVKKNLKPGFSLFEACVVMLIVGIFVALCANAYSKRHVTYQESDGHGRYECYKNAAGTLMQRYVENNNPRNVTGNTCVFRPPRYAKYLLLNAIGGGSAGDAGEFKSVFYSSLDKPITVEPGNVNGQTTIKIDGSVILLADAGRGNMNAASVGADIVSQCRFTYNKYNCGTPRCEQDGLNLSIAFCNDSGFVTNKIPITDIKKYRTSYSGNKLVYRDLSDFTGHGIAPQDALALLDIAGSYDSFYTIEVTFDTTLSSVSQMESYLDSLGIEDGIAAVQPGRAGKPGGVVIIW